MTDVKLGELSFSAEEIINPDYRNVDSEQKRARAYANRANKILAEKLAKCPSVWSIEVQPGNFSDWEDYLEHGDTHTARLVCIEEVKKL